MLRVAREFLKRTIPVPAWQRFRNHWWRYLRPLLVDYCPAMLPWFANARRDEPIARLHRLAADFSWRGERCLLITFSTWLGVVVWPFRLTLDGWQANRRYGPQIRQRCGLSRWRQAVQMARWGWGTNVPAVYYYHYRLFDPREAARAWSYLFADEMSVLYPLLSTELASDEPLRDKQRFFESSRKYGFRAVEVIAAFGDGAVLDWYGPEPGRLPSCDLVLKPVDLANGRGFWCCTYDAEEGVWSDGSASYDATQYLERCCRAAGDRRHVLQPRLINHPAMAAWGPAGLCTYRIVTYRRVSGESGVLLACLRMPTGASRVDNFEANGVAAPVDLGTGLLGGVVSKDPTRGRFEAHPDTGAAITGMPAPYYVAAAELAVQAHSCFPHLPFVGWDIGVVADGPCLVEANPDWGVRLGQIVPGRPLGETLYPEIFLEHLAAQQIGRGLATAIVHA